MVTLAKNDRILVDDDLVGEVEFRGLSTDAKPDTVNGAAFIEIDTGKVYFYNADSSAWVEF